MVYWISYYIFKIVMKVLFRGKSFGRENLPAKGPYIGIINHNSILDIPAMALVVKTKASTMVKHSLFDVPILGWWLRAVDMFPIVRGASDQASLEHALEVLQRGHVLYMAPEGTRKHESEEPPRPRTGFVRLAQMADCPVVPIAIVGTREALPPGRKLPRLVKIRAKVGRPIKLKKTEVSLQNRSELQSQAQMVMQVVYKLREELSTNSLN